MGYFILLRPVFFLAGLQTTGRLFTLRVLDMSEITWSIFEGMANLSKSATL